MTPRSHDGSGKIPRSVPPRRSFLPRPSFRPDVAPVRSRRAGATVASTGAIRYRGCAGRPLRSRDPSFLSPIGPAPSTDANPGGQPAARGPADRSSAVDDHRRGRLRRPAELRSTSARVGTIRSLLKQVWVGGIAPGRSVPSQEPPRSRPPLRSGDRARQAHAPTAGCASGVKRRVDGRDVIVQGGPQGP